MNERVANILVNHRYKSAICGLIVIIFCLVGFQYVEVRNDYREFFEDNDAIIERSEWLAERMGETNESAVIIYKPGSGSIFSNIGILQYQHIANQAMNAPYVENTRSLSDINKIVKLKAPQGNGQRYIDVGLFQGADIFSERGLEVFKRDVQSNSAINGRYVARDGKSAIVILELDLSAGSSSRAKKLTEIEAAVSKIEGELREVAPSDKLTLVGSTMFDHASSGILREDLRVLFPVAFLAALLIMTALFRSFLLSIVLMVVISLPVIATAGATQWLAIPFSTLTVSALLMVGTIAVADVVHIVSSYFIDFQKEENQDLARSAKKAISSNLQPVITTTLTTMVGGAIFCASASPAVRSMGVTIVLGVGLALLLALLFLPVVLTKLAKKPAPLSGVLSRHSPAFINFANRFHKAIVMSAVAVFAISAYFASMLSINDDLRTWFSPATEFRQGMDILNDQYLGLNTMRLAQKVKDEDQNEIGKLPQLEGSLTEVSKSHEIIEEKWEDSWLHIGQIQSEFRKRIAEDSETSFFLLPEQVEENPPKLSVNTLAQSGFMTQFEPGKQDYIISYFDPGDDTTFERLDKASEAKKLANDTAPGRNAEMYGTSLAFAELGKTNLISMAVGSLACFLIITIFLGIIFRSPYLGFVSIWPNLFPIVLIFGIVFISGGNINMATVGVFGMAFGLIVDDTVHTVLRFKRATLDGEHILDALRTAYRQCFAGITTTTVILSMGFLLLASSDFLLTADKALLVGLSIIAALLFDIIVLPAIIIWTSATSQVRQNLKA
ncbi:efflux RND transporter permease subunit [Parasphingorhabdus flavimaris]|uniref:efflux RND transporter permease subunit n=1 Tax=Parasphingorhabdus flavimaris TaxID=266812 RepID=UPI003001C4FF